MKRIQLNEAFKNIHVSFSLKSIRSLFLQTQLNYKPDYQRDYVWPAFKATYFIETILLHSEFSPIVTFLRKGAYEVIDGRQRCETIDRFLRDELTLRASGLEKLWYLANKKYSQLGPLQERIENATIRVITIQFKNEDQVDPHTEELVKREFFRRYNLGISPLKKEEVYKAQYLQDEINLFFKKRFQQDAELYARVKNIFDHRARNIEILMQSIRQMLVLHNIPIMRFLSERDDIVNMYYDYLSFENTGNEKVRPIFDEFKNKLNYLAELKPLIEKEAGTSNGSVYECLYWALSIAEVEKVKPEKIHNAAFKEKLAKHLAKHIGEFHTPVINQSVQKKTRYQLVAEFFSSQLHLDFNKYIKDPEFISVHKTRMARYMQERIMPGLEQDYFSKSVPTSSTILDILSRMQKQKFCIRPPYQRQEIKNELKASSLIESILKNIRLHPIYVYVRKDGVYEVIDGQQRLLSIIGFIGETYLDEDGRMSKSVKHRFRLRIKSGLMQELHGVRFNELSEEYQRTILDFDIDLIEIREENNPHFKPEELFKRLNYKPFPIKEHSFEFWNAYADGEIIRSVKYICEKTPWLYLKKKNSRMMQQELVLHLIYFTCVTTNTPATLPAIKEVLKIVFKEEKLSVVLKNKAHITQLLENEKRRLELIAACATFETDFLAKLKVLTYHPDSNNSDLARGRQLDNLLHAKGIGRTLTSFYLLWIITKGIPIPTISNNRPAVRNKINKIFEIFGDSDSTTELETAITNAWATLKNNILIAI